MSCPFYRDLSDEGNQRRKNLLITATDILASAISKQHITALAQAELLAVNNYAHSKSACNIFGQVRPSGKYRTLIKLQKFLGSEAPPLPEGDIALVFDNNQVNYREF